MEKPLDKTFDKINVTEIIRYLITGVWFIFVAGIFFPTAQSPDGAQAALLALSIGALTYHSFRSTLLPLITWIGDRWLPNRRLTAAREIGLKLSFINWAKINDEFKIKGLGLSIRESDRYELWLSSTIMLYTSGLGTCFLWLIGSNKNLWFLVIGIYLLLSGFCSQRFYETRVLDNWLYNRNGPFRLTGTSD